MFTIHFLSLLPGLMMNSFPSSFSSGMMMMKRKGEHKIIMNKNHHSNLYRILGTLVGITWVGFMLFVSWNTAVLGMFPTLPRMSYFQALIFIGLIWTVGRLVASAVISEVLRTVNDILDAATAREKKNASSAEDDDDDIKN